MKLRECRSCLPSEMKFSVSNYSIHWFKNSIVASLARFRPEIVIKGAGANASNLFRRTLVSSTVRIFVRRRWSVNVPRPLSRAVHERVHRGKARRRTLMENAGVGQKVQQRRETTNEEMFGFNVSSRWVSMLEIFQRKFLVYLEFLRLRDGKRKINSVWKLFVKILWILWNSRERWRWIFLFILMELLYIVEQGIKFLLNCYNWFELVNWKC